MKKDSEGRKRFKLRMERRKREEVAIRRKKKVTSGRWRNEVEWRVRVEGGKATV